MPLQDYLERIDGERLFDGFQKAMPSHRAYGRILEAEASVTMGRIHHYEGLEEYLVYLHGWLDEAADAGSIESDKALFVWLGAMSTIAAFIDYADNPPS